MPKKVLVALPAGLLEQIDMIAQAEHRNRSDLIREALRRYLDNFRRQQHVQQLPPAQPQPRLSVLEETFDTTRELTHV